MGDDEDCMKCVEIITQDEMGVVMVVVMMMMVWRGGRGAAAARRWRRLECTLDKVGIALMAVSLILPRVFHSL